MTARALSALAIVATAALVACGCAHLPSSRGHVDHWWTFRTEHIRVRTDFGPAQGAQFAWELEDTHRALSRVFFGCSAVKTVEVEAVVLANDADYVDVEDSWSAGTFHAARSDMAVQSARIVVSGHTLGVREVLIHELTHRFVQACFPAAPIWLNEGLAKFFQTLDIYEDHLVVGLPTYAISRRSYEYPFQSHGIWRDALPRRTFQPASAVVAADGGAFYHRADDTSAERTGNYASAWAIVHLLVLGRDRDLRHRMSQYLHALRDGSVDGARAFREAFRGAALDQALTAYLGGTSFPTRRIRYDAPTFPLPRPVAMSHAEAQLLWAELYAERGSTDRALQHLDAVVAAARGSQPHVAARALVLRAALGPSDERERRLGEAATLAPRDRDVVHASAWLARDDPRSPEIAERITELLAMRRPRTADRVLLVELLLGRDETRAAIKEARTAVREDPAEWSTHRALGRAFARANRAAEAVKELRTVINLVRREDPGTTERVEALIEEVREEDREWRRWFGDLAP